LFCLYCDRLISPASGLRDFCNAAHRLKFFQRLRQLERASAGASGSKLFLHRVALASNEIIPPPRPSFKAILPPIRCSADAIRRRLPSCTSRNLARLASARKESPRPQFSECVRCKPASVYLPAQSLNASPEFQPASRLDVMPNPAELATRDCCQPPSFKSTFVPTSGLRSAVPSTIPASPAPGLECERIPDLSARDFVSEPRYEATWWQPSSTIAVPMQLYSQNPARLRAGLNALLLDVTELSSLHLEPRDSPAMLCVADSPPTRAIPFLPASLCANRELVSPAPGGLKPQCIIYDDARTPLSGTSALAFGQWTLQLPSRAPISREAAIDGQQKALTQKTTLNPTGQPSFCWASGFEWSPWKHRSVITNAGWRAGLVATLEATHCPSPVETTPAFVIDSRRNEVAVFSRVPGRELAGTLPSASPQRLPLQPMELITPAVLRLGFNRAPSVQIAEQLAGVVSLASPISIVAPLSLKSMPNAEIFAGWQLVRSPSAPRAAMDAALPMKSYWGTIGGITRPLGTLLQPALAPGIFVTTFSRLGGRPEIPLALRMASLRHAKPCPLEARDSVSLSAPRWFFRLPDRLVASVNLLVSHKLAGAHATIQPSVSQSLALELNERFISPTLLHIHASLTLGNLISYGTRELSMCMHWEALGFRWRRQRTPLCPIPRCSAPKEMRLFPRGLVRPKPDDCFSYGSSQVMDSHNSTN